MVKIELFEYFVSKSLIILTFHISHTYTVYVPVNQQTSSDVNNRQQVTLKFRLTTRDDDYTDSEPFWKLKISQLECQTSSTNWWKIKDIARQVWDWEDDERDSNTKSKSYSLGKINCSEQRHSVVAMRVIS